MILFAATTTPRLQHAAAWLGNYLFGNPLPVVTDQKALYKDELIINYSNQSLTTSCFNIQPHTLLFENGIQPQHITVKHHDTYPFFFATAGDFHFDILAASFYLLQRYEEYEPHEKDTYGRYAHTNSIAYKNGFLQIPLVDIWVVHFKKVLEENFKNKHIQLIKHQFQFIPTYDVDIAYNFRGKGLFRTLGGLLRSVALRKSKEYLDRLDVMLAGEKDPFDIFEKLQDIHTKYLLNPIYFFLMAQRQRGVDKNINPAKKIYQKLIQKISAQYKTGIHISAAASRSPTTMQAEKDFLARITQQTVIANRNHYLLFTLPETYELLHKNPLKITEEYSMGYGTVNGFRASACTPYYWYNLQTEMSTLLQVFPFCYMEATSIFQLQQSPQQALKEMQQLYENVKQVDGLFITIFHNHLIGKNVSGQQWMEMYKQFLRSLS